MNSPTAFIATGPHFVTRFQYPDSCHLCSRPARISVLRRRRANHQVFALQESDRPDHVATSANGIPSADTASPGASETSRKLFHDVASSGEASLRDIGGAVKAELAEVSETTKQFAETMIEEETEALLERYSEKQRELLAIVDAERRVIEGELNRISELAESVGKGGSGRDGLSMRGKSLAAVAGIFAIAAVLYAFTAVVDGDSSAFTNAGIDALVAVAAAFFLEKEKANVSK